MSYDLCIDTIVDHFAKDKQSDSLVWRVIKMQSDKIVLELSRNYFCQVKMSEDKTKCESWLAYIKYSRLRVHRALFRTGATGTWHPWYFEFLSNGTREFFRNFWLTVAWHPWNFETLNKWHRWFEIPKEGPEYQGTRCTSQVQWVL